MSALVAIDHFESGEPCGTVIPIAFFAMDAD